MDTSVAHTGAFWMEWDGVRDTTLLSVLETIHRGIARSSSNIYRQFHTRTRCAMLVYVASVLLQEES